MTISLNTHHATVTNEELLTWLAEKGGGIQDEMREAMDISNQRADVKLRLSQLRADLVGANTEGKWERLAEDMVKYADTLAGEHEYAEVARKLNAIAERTNERLADDKEPSEKARQSWMDALQAFTDRMGTQDQMTMIRVQDLNSRNCQLSQLTSNLISASNQAVMSVVNNIKA